jgi:hypothetical protein
MILTLRLLICASAVAMAGYIVACAYPNWVAQLRTELHRLPKVQTDLDQELAFGRRLEEERAAILARAQAKQVLLMDLIDGRLTLVKTATRYRDLDLELGGNRLERLAVIWPGSCQLERYCYQIIQVAEWQLSESPDKAATVVARLKAELQAAGQAGAFCSAQ